MKRIFLLCCALCAASSLFAFDFGFLLDQSAYIESIGSDVKKEDFTYKVTAKPWFQVLFGDTANFYIMPAVTFEYSPTNDDDVDPYRIAPELLRTEFDWRPAPGMNLAVGRMQYDDPLGFIASGLFDGVSFSMPLAGGSVYAGGWYTGLLYKETANITMTSEELSSYNNEPLDWDDFSGTYFAPKRILAAAGYSNPGLAEWLRLDASVLGQFDMNGEESTYHSQYLVAKASVPVSDFIFTLGGTAEFIEKTEEDLKFAFAGMASIGWMLPTSIQDRLSLGGRFSSGVKGDRIDAFMPLTTESQGLVLKAKLSGLSDIELQYIARLHQTFSLDLLASYFIRSDLGTYQGYPGGTDGYMLGAEGYARAIWAPVSDLRVTLGGGAFLPQLGDVNKDADMMWRAELNVVLSLF
jgi:hypothetical protein